MQFLLPLALHAAGVRSATRLLFKPSGCKRQQVWLKEGVAKKGEDGTEAKRASFREQINQRAAPRSGKLSNDFLQSCSSKVQG